MNRSIRTFLAAVALSCLCAGAGAAEMTPDALAKSVTEDVLAVLRTDKALQEGDKSKLLDLVEKKILPHFDFVRMTRLAVGRNWRQASPEQRKALVDEFRTLLVHTYAATFTGYRDQTVEFRPLQAKPEDTEVVVKSLIHQPGGKPVQVDYRMAKDAASWKVYDVIVADLSLILAYRGGFEAEVRKGGIDGLIKALASKNRDLASGQTVASGR